MMLAQKKTFILTLFSAVFCLLILGIGNIVNATDVVSLYGDKDGFGIGVLPEQYFDLSTATSDTADPLNTDVLMYGEKYWTHTYDTSGLGTIKSASLEVFAGGVGWGGSAAPIFLNGKFLGNLKPMEIEGNIARLSSFDLMPFVSELNGSTIFTIWTFLGDGWVLDYSQLTISDSLEPVLEHIIIDIKPGSSPNSINLKSGGKIPVAILSTTNFYAPGMVDENNLTFGRTGDEQSLAFCSESPEDINCDGLEDLVCYFYTESTGFQCGDTVGILKDIIKNGTSIIEGRDCVKIVPCQ